MAEPGAMVLQLCPNDHPPFLDICAVYERAFAELGRPVLTVFLEPARAEPMQGAEYLDQERLRQTRVLGGGLDGVMDRLDQPLQLVVCHRYRALVCLGASRLQARRTVCVAHEFGMFRRARRRLRRRLLQRRVRFAGVSDAVVEELSRAVPNVMLLPNGIDLEHQAQARLGKRAAQTELSLRAEDFNVGVVGRLHPKKQPELALAGFAAFANEHANATLTFLGDGELMGSLRGAARGMSVRFAGHVARAARLLSAFDVLLIPSGELEAFNMVALEALAAGVLVVAGPAPGPRFVLGDVGVFFDAPSPAAVASALARARASGGEDRARRGVRRAEEEFSVPVLARRLRSLLAE